MAELTSYILFLDDIRNPTLIYPASVDTDWVIAKNYDEFVKVITDNGLPTLISFDHDLADEHYRPSMYAADGHYSNYYSDGTFREKTGYDCAKWLIEHCLDKNIDLPKWNVHSANPVGRKNIEQLLSNYDRYRNQ